jgi:pimeloyl-ACP methyl ester carboxylesterase
MWILPVTLLISYVLGFILLVGLLWSVWTFYRIGFRHRRIHSRGRSETLGWTVREKGLLGIAALLLLLCLAGRPLVLLFFPSGSADLRHRTGTSGTFLDRPDGARLYVESDGRAGSGTIILTHGWGADANMWQYARRDLAPAHRILTWDLRGLGASTQPGDRDYSLDRMADDLHAVIESVDGPVVLVGHSIGGMINLTYARRHPVDVGNKVVGIAELNSTYTNPVRTTKGASLATALQKPVAEPLLYATIALSPFVRVLNTLRYLSGVSHIQNAGQSFAGTETRQQLDFVSRYEMLSTPSVVARGGLAMFHWDGSDAFEKISVPVLLIAGNEDTTTVPEASAHMQKRIAAAQLVLSGPAKHMGPIERNREYNAALSSFATACFRRDHLESRRFDPSTGN